MLSLHTVVSTIGLITSTPVPLHPDDAIVPLPGHGLYVDYSRTSNGAPRPAGFAGSVQGSQAMATDGNTQYVLYLACRLMKASSSVGLHGFNYSTALLRLTGPTD